MQSKLSIQEDSLRRPLTQGIMDDESINVAMAESFEKRYYEIEKQEDGYTPNYCIKGGSREEEKVIMNRQTRSNISVITIRGKVISVMKVIINKEKRNFTSKEELEANSIMLLTYKGKENNKENTWYLQSKASNHMCGIKVLFKELNESMQGEVAFSDSSKMPVKDKRNIMTQTKT